MIRESFRAAARAWPRWATRSPATAARRSRSRSPRRDGSIRGLDVFGGFLRDGNLYLMGEIRTPFRREWVFPLGHGHARGPRRSRCPPTPTRLLDRDLRPGLAGPRPGLPLRDARRRPTAGSTAGSAASGSGRPRGTASTRRLPAAPPASRAVGVATGSPPEHGVPARVRRPRLRARRRRALARPEQGATAWGLDYVPEALRAAAEAAARTTAVDLDFLYLNLLELRSVLGDRCAARPRPGPQGRARPAPRRRRDRVGRGNLCRLAGMLLRDGGRLYLEFLSRGATTARRTGAPQGPRPDGSRPAASGREPRSATGTRPAASDR